MQFSSTSFLNKRITVQHCGCLLRQRRQQLSVKAVATRSKVNIQQRPAVDVLERSLQLESSSGCDQAEASSSGSSETRTSKRSIDEGEVLHSTFEHQAIVYGTTGLLSALLVKGLSDVHDLPGIIGAAVAALLAYYVSGDQQLPVIPLYLVLELSWVNTSSCGMHGKVALLLPCRFEAEGNFCLALQIS